MKKAVLLETNGIANCMLIIDYAKKDNKIDDKIYASLSSELNTLLEYFKSINKTQEVPMWHDIKRRMNEQQ